MLLTNQEEAVLRVLAGEDVAIKGGTGTGGTYTLARCIVAAMRKCDGLCVLMVAPYTGIVHNGLIPEIYKVMAESSIPGHIKGAQVYIGRSFATTWSFPQYAEPPESIRGRMRLLLAADHAEGVPVRVLTALEDISGQCVQTVMTGLPLVHTGLLWHAFRWHRITNSGANNPRVSPDFVDRMKSQFGEDSDACRARIFGEFPTARPLE